MTIEDLYNFLKDNFYNKFSGELNPQDKKIPIVLDGIAFRVSLVVTKVFTQILEENIYDNVFNTIQTKEGLIFANEHDEGYQIIDLTGTLWTVITVLDMYVD